MALVVLHLFTLAAATIVDLPSLSVAPDSTDELKKYTDLYEKKYEDDLKARMNAADEERHSHDQALHDLHQNVHEVHSHLAKMLDAALPENLLASGSKETSMANSTTDAAGHMWPFDTLFGTTAGDAADKSTKEDAGSKKGDDADKKGADAVEAGEAAESKKPEEEDGDDDDSVTENSASVKKDQALEDLKAEDKTEADEDEEAEKTAAKTATPDLALKAKDEEKDDDSTDGAEKDGDAKAKAEGADEEKADAKTDATAKDADEEKADAKAEDETAKAVGEDDTDENAVEKAKAAVEVEGQTVEKKASEDSSKSMWDNHLWLSTAGLDSRVTKAETNPEHHSLAQDTGTEHAAAGTMDHEADESSVSKQTQMMMNLGASVRMLVMLPQMLDPLKQKLMTAFVTMPTASRPHVLDIMDHIQALEGYSKKAEKLMAAVIAAKNGTVEEKREGLRNLVEGMQGIQEGVHTNLAALKADVAPPAVATPVDGKLDDLLKILAVKVAAELKNPATRHSAKTLQDVRMFKALKESVDKAHALIYAAMGAMEKAHTPKMKEEIQLAVKVGMKKLVADVKSKMALLRAGAAGDDSEHAEDHAEDSSEPEETNEHIHTGEAWALKPAVETAPKDHSVEHHSHEIHHPHKTRHAAKPAEESDSAEEEDNVDAKKGDADPNESYKSVSDRITALKEKLAKEAKAESKGVAASKAKKHQEIEVPVEFVGDKKAEVDDESESKKAETEEEPKDEEGDDDDTLPDEAQEDGEEADASAATDDKEEEKVVKEKVAKEKKASAKKPAAKSRDRQEMLEELLGLASGDDVDKATKDADASAPTRGTALLQKLRNFDVDVADPTSELETSDSGPTGVEKLKAVAEELKSIAQGGRSLRRN